MTNGDWLRSQGDEEMAELIAQGEAYARVFSVIEGTYLLHGSEGEIL